MDIVAFSDTHERHRQVTVPNGDVLVFAGDMTVDSSRESIKRFASWIDSLEGFEDKIVIAGNHDIMAREIDFDRHFDDAVVLQDSSVTVDGVTFYGTPWCPTVEFSQNPMRLNDDVREAIYSSIPDDVDVIISHSPPYGSGDYVDEDVGHIGDKVLRDAVADVDYDLHIFGHVHEHHGRQRDGAYNVSVTDSNNVVQYPPIVINYEGA